MKKTIMMENMQATVEVENGKVSLVSINPILILSNKRYILDVSNLDSSGDRIIFNPCKIGTVDAKNESRASAEITRLIINSKSLFVYSIRKPDGSYNTRSEMRFFKDTSAEKYIVLLGEKVFYVDEKSTFIKRAAAANYTTLVSLNISAYHLDKMYERTIVVRGNSYSVGSSIFSNLEEADKFALKSIFDNLNLNGTEQKEIKIRKKKKYINADSPEFIAVAKKYEAGKIGYMQATAKLNISTAGFGRKMQEYRKMQEVAATSSK